LGTLCADRITLKLIFKKYISRLYIDFGWLWAGYSGGFYRYRNGRFGSIKDAVILDELSDVTFSKGVK
jgi:hypothetical protein